MGYSSELQHGTRAAYTRWGCRCDRCRAANTHYFRSYRARRKAGVVRPYRKGRP
jgi:hypothetical protein